MKKRVLALLLLLSVVLAAVFMPDYILRAQEQQLYGQMRRQEVLSAQFAWDDTTLYQRLVAISNYSSITELDYQTGNSAYLDNKALLELFRRELDTLAEDITMVRAIRKNLIDNMAWNEENCLDFFALGYCCALNLSTGDTYVLAYLTGSETVRFCMDMISEKIIYIEDYSGYVDYFSHDFMTTADAVSFAGYLGLTCQAEGDSMYRFQEKTEDRESELYYCIEGNAGIRIVPAWVPPIG